MRGLGLRISFIITAAIAVVVVIGVVVVYVNRQRDPLSSYHLPLPQQLAAIVASIESASADRLPTLLTALNSSSLGVAVVEARPPDFGRLGLPGLAWLVRQYLPAMEGRSVEAMLRLPGDDPRMQVRRDDAGIWSTRPVRLVVALKDGRYAVIEARGEYVGQIAGFRLAFLALIASVLISALSLWAVKRQIRPLETLAAAVERFGPGLAEAPLERKGAREVRQLADALERMRARIRELVAARSRMTAAIGHDLRTYLTRLRLRADFIADPDQRAKAVGDIAAMEALTRGSLTLAQLDHDSETGTPTDLVALVARQVDLIAPDGADDRPVRLHAREPVEARVRPLALGRALANLISNALTYGGEADVTVGRATGMAEILVEDRGPGIPPAERAAVFEPFYRQGAARTLDDPGFGLGLAIVAEIVAQHQGTIALEDRPGGGLTVRLRLPLG